MKRFCICCSKLSAEDSWVCDDCRDLIRVGITALTRAAPAYHQCPECEANTFGGYYKIPETWAKAQYLKKLCSRCARRAARILKPPPESLVELCERVNS